MSKFELCGTSRCKDISVSFGDLFMWTGEVCLYCNDGLVSLKDPSQTWDMNREYVLKNIESGDITKMPSGTVVTLTQE